MSMASNSLVIVNDRGKTLFEVQNKSAYDYWKKKEKKSCIKEQFQEMKKRQRFLKDNEKEQHDNEQEERKSGY